MFFLYELNRGKPPFAITDSDDIPDRGGQFNIHDIPILADLDRVQSQAGFSQGDRSFQLPANL
ncbi:hypothetical protein [Pseudanabaena sp. PCC 6802]|uniref:hypothetical protein n=1 Tax=Pseudanabaena sp. PCC 6802 TaxID=118173 RepID=UPI00034AB9D3|nr:hypothetical protein [Pseudanabaena sp. PCC 6802]